MSVQAQAATKAPSATALSPVRGSTLQRKCVCGSHTMGGGQCADCAKNKSGLQRKLAIGASNDPLEQEADRIADQVLAASGHSAVSGALPRIQRFTGRPSAEMGTAPASVDRVLSSPGRPLELTLQQDMGQRFGHDFSRVRVHSGAAAEQSAQDVNAYAYTVGSDMVFGSGQFAPGTHEGRRLIAHELTHVVQQTGAIPRRIGESNETHGLSPMADPGHASVYLARRTAPVAPAPMRPPPMQGLPGGRTAPGMGRPLRGMPRAGPRYAAEPGSIEGVGEGAADMKDYESRQVELERPVATLQRGGSPPDFITAQGRRNQPYADKTVNYEAYAFHVLDAIEYRVSRANTEEDITRVLIEYIEYQPLTVPRPAVPRPGVVPLFGPVFEPDLDLGGTERLRVYAAAVAKRGAQVSAVGAARVAPARIPEEARKRGCVILPATPLGDDPLGEAFCQIVTGGSLEYKVTTPMGDSVQYDAMIGDVVYECKCGYGRVFDTYSKWLETGEGRYRWAEYEMDRRAKQMLTQRRVAGACGLKLRYVVSNESFAQLLNEAWGRDPVVIARRWDECG